MKEPDKKIDPKELRPGEFADTQTTRIVIRPLEKLPDPNAKDTNKNLVE